MFIPQYITVSMENVKSYRDIYENGFSFTIDCGEPIIKTVKNKDGLNRAEFDISEILKSKIGKNGVQSYFRVTIRDFEGNEAYTRAYFIDEFIE